MTITTVNSQNLNTPIDVFSKMILFCSCAYEVSSGVRKRFFAPLLALRRAHAAAVLAGGGGMLRGWW